MSFPTGDHHGGQTPSSSDPSGFETAPPLRAQSDQTRVEEVIETLYQRIFELEQRVSSAALAPPAEPVYTRPREPKASEPEHFRGDRAKLNSFLTQVNIVFSLEPSRFTTEDSKIMYAANQFRDRAMTWIRPQLDLYMARMRGETLSSHLVFTTFEQLVQHLQTTFGDVNEVATAERELRALRQTLSVAQYSSEFQRIVSVLQWDEKALIFNYYTGLKDNVKDEISRSGRPETLNELILLSTKIDGRIYERYRERQFEHKAHVVTKPAFRPFVSNSATPAFHSHEPMDLSASMPQGSTARGKLTDSEKKHRRDHNLCMYCGTAGHVVATCPQLAG